LLSNVFGLAQDRVAPAFESLTGEIYASAMAVSLQVEDQYSRSVRRRLELMRVADNEKNVGGWVVPYGSVASIDGGDLATDVDRRLRGITVGFDNLVSSNLRLGAHASIAHSEIELDGRSDRIDVDHYHAGVHGLYNPAPYWVQGTMAYGWLDAESKRDISVTSFNRRAEGDYNGSAVVGAVEAGTRIPAGRMHVEPLVGVYYSRVKFDEFTEKNADDGNLRVASGSEDSLAFGVGARLLSEFEMPSGSGRWRPLLQGRYLRATRDNTPVITNAFAGASDATFRVSGVTIDRDRWEVGAGAAFDFTKHASAFIEYDATLADNYTGHALAAGFRYSW
jgi:outer membrane autotransporter protein